MLIECTFKCEIIIRPLLTAATPSCSGGVGDWAPVVTNALNRDDDRVPRYTMSRLREAHNVEISRSQSRCSTSENLTRSCAIHVYVRDRQNVFRAILQGG